MPGVIAGWGPGRIQGISLLEYIPRIVILQKGVPSSLVLFSVWGKVVGASILVLHTSGKRKLLPLLRKGYLHFYFMRPEGGNEKTRVDSSHHNQHLLLQVTPWCSKKIYSAKSVWGWRPAITLL